MNGFFEQSQIDLGYLFSDFPALLEGFQTFRQMWKDLFGKIMHLSFMRNGDRQIMKISVSRVTGLVAVAVCFSAAVLAEFYQAALNHLIGQLPKLFSKQALAVEEYS